MAFVHSQVQSVYLGRDARAVAGPGLHVPLGGRDICWCRHRSLAEVTAAQSIHCQSDADVWMGRSPSLSHSPSGLAPLALSARDGCTLLSPGADFPVSAPPAFLVWHSVGRAVLAAVCAFIGVVTRAWSMGVSVL